MTETKGKLKFHIGEDDWELYTERLELYFVAKDIKDEKRVAVLLTKISPETYKLVRDLCAPQKPKDKAFDELVKLVKDHLCQKPSEVMERCKFHQAQQTTTETIAEFIARLKSLATHCNFADINLAMRDQLVCGLRDHAIKAILFREENLTYDSAYKLAVAAEAAKKIATSTDKLQPSATLNSEVHLIKEWQRWRSPNKQQPTVPMGTCYCCGWPNHFARYRYKTCTRCKKRGHIEMDCREGQGSVQQMETKDEPLDPEEDGYTSDFLVIENSGSTTEAANVDITGDNIAAGPITVNVKINDVDVIMEIDTGAYVAAISKVTKERLFPNLKIEKLNKSFNAYGKVKLEHEGIIKGYYVKSKENGKCDALSRLPVCDALPIFDNEYTSINYISETLDVLNASINVLQLEK
ncbi:uncharacterized protein LOC112455390 [Temnothorax curvispinosus]|uniref:Uncharacterized protein LOC112455390 n=1 Tax=Temnothorax curvispinosus TaxID=300111 RepID=A0A6J1PT71_9HYME|nr:uncharacterized protein LOC112455390 [Temnothorax curvispinosus]